MATARFVSRYVQRNARLGDTRIVQPVPARLEQVIAFQFASPCLIQRGGSVEKAPDMVVAGAQTGSPTTLLLQGSIDAFYIFLRPAALRALFGIPMAELANRSGDAMDLLGHSILTLRDQLANAASFALRVAAAEQFLQRRSAAPPPDWTERVVARILERCGAIPIAELAREVSLSQRHLDRAFTASVGMPPKVFARIARFQAALEYKTRSPRSSWARTAQEFQYHDQMHLVRDFRKLSGESPTGLMGRLAFLDEARRTMSDLYYPQGAEPF
jgi:AraC-like DNA-binding protein